jgi:serine/threonine-protein kinase
MPELLARLQTALADRYRLDHEIGAGGMATVFLAHDLRHNRRVALKVLKPELAAVIGAERFLAEIQLTANLQHPHILPLFDSGEAVVSHQSSVVGAPLTTDDSRLTSFLYYVMPFVEGETLRDRINREKQLPVADAVRITTEVAAALDYAHRHGVVHRDIKPENILLHDGSALVADFGIALAASKASGNRMTETGMSLGTPHYMSPEQAMGEREITARSDVYALGAVLYEMLTGEPPFTGTTAQAVVARVLTETPRPMLPQRHTIPQHVEAAVITALEKLPADRFASAAEFAEALRNKGYSSAVTTAVMPGAARPGMPAARRLAPLTIAALAAAALATAAALWGWLRPAPVAPLNQFSLALRTGEVLQAAPPTGGSRVAISRDGRRMAYLGPGEGNPRLWVRRMDQLAATPIAGSEGGTSPFFSPDGRQVGFIQNGTVVKVASLEGAPTLTLYDRANSTAGDWGDDGYVYFEVDSGIARVRPTGGTPEQVYNFSADKGVAGTEWPSVLPGATGLVFRTRRSAQAMGDFEIMGMTLPHGKAHVLTRGVLARYSPTGHLLVVTADGKLIGLPFDRKKVEVTGPPIALAEGIGVRNGGFNVDLALSGNGTLLYTTGGAAASRRAVWVTREGSAGEVDPAWDPQGSIEEMALSPDGKALAVTLSRGGRTDIWVKQLPSGPFSRITFGDTSSVRPAWSPDGKEVLSLNDRAGQGVGSINAHRADGTGAGRRVVPSALDFGQVQPSRDGRWLVMRTAVTGPTNADVFAVRAGDTALVPLVNTPANEMFPALSPDGHWLAYASNESGAMEVYVRPFPETATAKWQVSTTGGTEPAWSPDGRELFYVNGKTELIAAEIRPGATFSVGEQRRLFSVDAYLRPGSYPRYAVSPDGRRFMMIREGQLSQQSELILAENWLQVLRAKP